MTIRRIFRLPALAALAAPLLLLAACSADTPGSDAPDGPAPMEFVAAGSLDGTDSPSRAATASPLDGSQYRIWAWAVYHETAASSSFYFSTSSAKELTYRPATNLFAAENYFYPYIGTMDFVAVTTNGNKPYALSVSPTSLSAGASFNSLTASFVSGYTGAYEVAYTGKTVVDCKPNMEPLVLRFHRPQANLRFHFTAVDEPTCAHVIINSILVENVYCRAKYTVNLSTGAVTWASAVKESLNVDNLTAHTIDFATGLDAGNGLYIKPQANRSRIIINYTMVNDNIIHGNIGADNTRTMNYVVVDDYSEGWLAGHQYTYNIVVRGNYQMDIRDVDVELVSEGSTGTMNI